MDLGGSKQKAHRTRALAVDLPEKMFLSTLFSPKPKVLSWLPEASSEQSPVALVVVISHLLCKLKVSKILKLSSWRSMLPQLSLLSPSAASSISLMILVFSKLLGEAAADI